MPSSRTRSGPLGWLPLCYCWAEFSLKKEKSRKKKELLELLHNVAARGRKLLLKISSDFFSGLLPGGGRQPEAALYTAVFCRRQTRSWPPAIFGVWSFKAQIHQSSGAFGPPSVTPGLNSCHSAHTAPLFHTPLGSRAAKPGRESEAELSFLPFLNCCGAAELRVWQVTAAVTQQCWAGGSAPLSCGGPTASAWKPHSKHSHTDSVPSWWVFHVIMQDMHLVKACS